MVKRSGIIDGDFFLADLLSKDNYTLKDKLFVVLMNNQYKFDKKFNEAGFSLYKEVGFNDSQKAHKEFWDKYDRPPIEEYWDYIINRRDLLVPQDIRERKGSFFTPRQWVELSQKYIGDVLGEDWQDEYYIWDCAAGTGNLLAGLTNKLNIWASTLDTADVDVMKDRIKNGANLLESHVFQFDFLNDDFSELPKNLKDIIDDSERRKKLIIYINPPYAEGDAKIGKGRKGIHESKIHDKYQNVLSRASGELFAQFLIRIYKEMEHCIIANFATLKMLSAPNFAFFRENFQAKLETLFAVPAYTFDNVIGQFHIGFHIWNTEKKEKFEKTNGDIYNADGSFLGNKTFFSYDGSKYISDWLEKNSKNISKNYIGHLASVGNDFQHQDDVYIDDVNRKKIAGGRHTMISAENLIIVFIYFTIRHCIEHTWINHYDQFLFPNDKWESDLEFQSDCLIFTLFHGKFNISSKYGINHWILFSEIEVNAKDNFESHFIHDFINGKIYFSEQEDFFIEKKKKKMKALRFSDEAKAVHKAGKKLWKYYHSQPSANVNASFYDIREFFQGRNDSGRMNNKSGDDTYNALISDLRSAQKTLALKIQPKVYEYGFLLE